jgi:hypothetical protein
VSEAPIVSLPLIRYFISHRIACSQTFGQERSSK